MTVVVNVAVFGAGILLGFLLALGPVIVIFCNASKQYADAYDEGFAAAWKIYDASLEEIQRIYREGAERRSRL